MSDAGTVKAIAVEATRAFVQQRYADAAAGYERCIALMPGEPAFHFNLGTAREKQGDLGRAVDAYLAAWRLNPRDARLALFGVRPSRRPDGTRTRRSCSPSATTSTWPSGVPRTARTSIPRSGDARRLRTGSCAST